MTTLIFLTEEQAKELFRKELKDFFARNPILVEQQKSEPKTIDLGGSLTYLPKTKKQIEYFSVRISKTGNMSITFSVPIFKYINKDKIIQLSKVLCKAALAWLII